jgi:hypothetical protein
MRPPSLIRMSYYCILCHKNYPGLSVFCSSCRTQGVCTECHARSVSEMHWHLKIPPDSEIQRGINTVGWQLVKWAFPVAIFVRFVVALLFAKLPG